MMMKKREQWYFLRNKAVRVRPVMAAGSLQFNKLCPYPGIALCNTSCLETS